MDFNFIEEVSKALDTLSVERLVRESPMGSVRCRKCSKILYTAVQARYVIIKMFHNEQKYMDMYICPEQEGENYHISNIGKRLDKLENKWLRRGLEQKKADLDQLGTTSGVLDGNGDRVNTHVVGAQNLVIVDGRSAVPYAKALRLKIRKALVVSLQGLRKPRIHLVRRSYKPFRRTPRRDTARRDYPRGETITKMLSWANAEKFHVGRADGLYNRPKGPGAPFRRRNRAREVEAVRREIEREGDAHAVYSWRESRSFNMNDEYSAPSHAVWKALAEDDEGYRFIEFDGKYTVES